MNNLPQNPEGSEPPAMGSGGQSPPLTHANSSLLVVGSVALDSVETRAGKRAEVLGGAATYFSVAASFLAPTPVRLTAVVGDDFADAHTKLLESRNVDLAGLERVKGGRTFRWAGVYAPDFSTRTSRPVWGGIAPEATHDQAP